MALRLLVAEGAAEDEARWAKRTAANVIAMSAKGAPRGELEALLAAPLPDDHDDLQHGAGAPDDDEVLEEIDAEGDAAASATEHFAQADRGYSISHPPVSHPQSTSSAPMASSSPPSGLEGLARLTRSGENSARIISTPPDDIGKAKGEDSGLIDLRGMSQSGEKPAAAEAARAEISGVTPAVASPGSAPASARPMAAAAPPSGAIAPPSTMAAQVASAPQVSTAVATTPRSGRKSSNVVWFAFGGLAAAAAVGLFVVNSQKSAPETASGSQPMSEKSKSVADKGDDDDKAKAKSPEAMASSTATATASPDETASAAPSDGELALAPTTTTGIGKKASPAGTLGTPIATGKATATATAKPTASAEPPKPNPSGGSLDDVLGINKPPPPPTATANTPDLPDKPETADMRVAVNSKVGTANACVKGLDGPSSVSVVFSPAGTVASVSVTSGPAKGTGAEACIKSAFSSAKVGRSKLGGTGYAKLGS
ncbi:MAG: hypothetical protein ABI175_06440 [Polyangiales bacterium]